MYGKGENPTGPFATVIAKFIDRFNKGLPLEVTKPGTQTRNFTHIEDLIDAVMLVFEKGTLRSYQIGNPQAFSINKVAQMFPNAKIIYTAEAPGNRTGVSAVKNDDLYKLGWQPTRSLSSYIKDNV